MLDPDRPAFEDDNLTPARLSAALGTSPAALAMMRSRGTGPRYSKLGARLIVYRRADVEEWIASGLRCSTGEVPTK
jgi:predicted DNA-binding transcriptional regulator AlpA